MSNSGYGISNIGYEISNSECRSKVYAWSLVRFAPPGLYLLCGYVLLVTYCSSGAGSWFRVDFEGSSGLNTAHTRLVYTWSHASGFPLANRVRTPMSAMFIGIIPFQPGATKANGLSDTASRRYPMARAYTLLRHSEFDIRSSIFLVPCSLFRPEGAKYLPHTDTPFPPITKILSQKYLY
jgi:hypothetical protein